MLGWTFAWLGGTAAIAGYSIVRHAPALERLMLDDVRQAVAPLSDAPLAVSVRDHVATLSGTVDGAAERDAVLAAAGEALGIRRVVDRLVVSDPVPSTVMPTATSDATGADEPSGSGGEVARDTASGTPLAVAGAPQSALPTDGSTLDELPPEGELEPDEALEAELELAELPVEASPSEDTVEPEATPAEGDELAELPVEAPPSEDTVEPDAPLAEEDALAERPVETPPGDVPESDAVPAEALAAESSLERQPREAASDAGGNDATRLAGRRAPTLRLDVVDRVLTMEGSLSKDDDAAALVLTAMDSFELDYVSNTLESEKDVAPAGWLAPISALLSEMTALDDPGIEVSGRQVTLYGTAPDAATRGAVLGAALERLGDYSLVERIDVGDTGGNVPPGPAPADDAVSAGKAIPGTPSTDEIDGDGPSAASDAASPPEDAASTAGGIASGADAPDIVPPGDDPSDVAAPDVVPSEADPSDVASSDEGTPDEDPAGGDVTAGDAVSGDPSDGDSAAATEPLLTALLVSPRAGDGRTDFAPLASPVAALRAALATLPTGRILFESGSDTLTEESRATLDGVAEVLLAHPGVPVAIEGHTDGRGLREANLELSQRRANAVRDHLVSRGVSYGRLTSYGYGEGVPIADNATPEGRAANRRIEFTF